MIRAWHNQHSGSLNIWIGRWFKLNLFAAPKYLEINDGKPSLTIAVTIWSFYRVFIINTT